MDEQLPATPKALPQVPGKILWSTLLAPPLASAVALMIVVTAPLDNETTALAIYLILVIQAGLIPGLSFHFRDAVAKRYSGISRTFLVCSYLLGQFIVCIILWIGIGLVALMIVHRSP